MNTIALALLLAGCSSPGLAPTPTTSSGALVLTQPAATQPTPSGTVSTELCDSGRLLVGDLPAMDRASKRGIEAAKEKAKLWQADAILTGLNVACELFESDFRWQATFYSRNAQAFLASDTGEVQPASVDASAVPTLNVDTLSFSRLHDTLISEGFSETSLIDPTSGVEVRLNTIVAPFGPPTAPKDALLFHVAIEKLGEMKDVYVDATTGKAYWYER